jgi:hypothetical protein
MVRAPGSVDHLEDDDRGVWQKGGGLTLRPGKSAL